MLMHAFDGKPSVAMTGIQHGFYFSVPPSVLRSDEVNKIFYDNNNRLFPVTKQTLS